MGVCVYLKTSQQEKNITKRFIISLLRLNNKEDLAVSSFCLEASFFIRFKKCKATLTTDKFNS